MAGKRKKTLDYFPHFVVHGKTIQIIERKWQNDGYAFWFKLLEHLCQRDGFFLDYNDETEKEFFLSRVNVDESTATTILDLLCKLKNIDPELWAESKIVWCQALVDNVRELLERRADGVPQKPSRTASMLTKIRVERDHCQQRSASSGIIVNKDPQIKGKERKGKEMKVNFQADDKKKAGEINKIPDEIKAEWRNTLTHFGYSENWIRDEQQIMRVYFLVKEWTRVKHALAGFRFEEKSDKYDPSKHVSLGRLLQTDKFNRLELLGENGLHGKFNNASGSKTDIEAILREEKIKNG